MSFSGYYISRRTRKGNVLIDWKPLGQLIRQHYAPVSDVTSRPAYPGLLLFKMLLAGLWHGGLSDEAEAKACMRVVEVAQPGVG